MTVIVGPFVIRPLNLSFQNWESCATAGPRVIRRDEMCACVNTQAHVASGVFVSTLCLTRTSTIICIITSLTHTHEHKLTHRATRTRESGEIRKQNPEWWENNSGLEGSFASLWIYFRLIVISDKGTPGVWCTCANYILAEELSKNFGRYLKHDHS